ncbi:MAG: sugar transferase [Candidatus Zhuqueibacterota bacterium]
MIDLPENDRRFVNELPSRMEQFLSRAEQWSDAKDSQRRLKRILDLCLASLFIVLLLPLFLLIGMCIKATSRGPILFQQTRIGFHGRKFTILKFRTMRASTPGSDHEQLIRKLLAPDSGASQDSVQGYKKQIDSHVTQIGKLLRRTSLDELPQLINVLRGDLSLVGPRPHPVYEVENYKDWYHERFQVMPGMTGLSKLKLRCTPQNYDESMRLDLEYIRTWSIGLDVKILLQTILLVLRMSSAY